MTERPDCGKGLVHAGVVTPYDRKREIYQICREYNITIIEDDAYFYLQYPTLEGTHPPYASAHVVMPTQDTLTT